MFCLYCVFLNGYRGTFNLNTRNCMICIRIKYKSLLWIVSYFVAHFAAQLRWFPWWCASYFLCHTLSYKWCHATKSEPKISLFLFIRHTWMCRMPVTCAASNNFRLQLTSQLPWSTTLASVFIFLLHYYFTPPHFSALTWVSCDGTQTFFRKSLVFRWLRGSLVTRFHTFSYSFLNNLLLLSWFHLCLTHCLHFNHLTITFIWPVTVEQTSMSDDVFKEAERAALSINCKIRIISLTGKTACYITSQVELISSF